MCARKGRAGHLRFVFGKYGTSAPINCLLRLIMAVGVLRNAQKPNKVELRVTYVELLFKYVVDTHERG